MKQRFFTEDDKAAYLLITPFFLFFTLFVLAPIGYNAAQSLTNATGLTKHADFVFLDNYIKLWHDQNFIKALKNTIFYTIGSVFPLVFLGFFTAVAVNSKAKRMIAARSILAFPYIMSMVAASMIWLMMFEPNNGVINKLFSFIGLPNEMWLFDKRLALGCLIFVNIWKNMGYVMLIYLSGLQTIPADLYEATRVDGASRFTQLFRITLPLMSPVTVFVFVTVVIESFKTFDQVRVMTDGNPLMSTTTVVHQIYIKAFGEFKYGYAASMSIVLFAVIFGVTIVNLLFSGFWRDRDK